VPFNVVIPDDQQDKRLAERLRRELPGILAWCVRGCLDWQSDGLGEPSEVQTATADYRAEQDTLGDFIAERCVIGSEYRARAGALYKTYREWCDESGEHPQTQRRFGQRMTERGYQRFTNNGVWYHGLGLLEEL
jgi:putative DNA primase/helicase